MVRPQLPARESRQPLQIGAFCTGSYNNNDYGFGKSHEKRQNRSTAPLLRTLIKPPKRSSHLCVQPNKGYQRYLLSDSNTDTPLPPIVPPLKLAITVSRSTARRGA